MVLSTNSEIAATVMVVDFRFNMGIYYANKSKSTFVWGNFGEIVQVPLTQKTRSNTIFTSKI